MYGTTDSHVVSWDIKENEKLYHPYKSAKVFYDAFIDRISVGKKGKVLLKKATFSVPLNEHLAKKKGSEPMSS